MFKDGGEVVVEGILDEHGVFHANTLLTSCPSKYEAEKEAGKMHPGTLPDYQKQPAPDFKQTETLPKAAI
jgi:cytochrome c-type biogenesis protein CcmE